jgi:hypothetical protein
MVNKTPIYADALADKMGIKFSKDSTGKSVLSEADARRIAIKGKQGEIPSVVKILKAAEKKSTKALGRLGLKKNSNPDQVSRLREIAILKELLKSGLISKEYYKKSKAEKLSKIAKDMTQKQLNQL